MLTELALRQIPNSTSNVSLLEMTPQQSRSWLRLVAVLMLVTANAKMAAEEAAAKKSWTVSSEALAGITFGGPTERAQPPLNLALWSEAATALPAMQVTARSTKLSETEVLTKKGLLDYAKKRYTTPLYRVTFGPLAQLGMYYLNFLSVFGGWHPNDAEAMALYREDDRVRIEREVDSLVSLVESQGSKQERAELKQLRFDVRQQGIQSLYWNPFKKN